MTHLHGFYKKRGELELQRGEPILSENIPPAAAEQLRDMGLAIQVEFQTLSPEKLLRKTQQFFPEAEMKQRSYLIDFSAERVLIYATEDAGCFHAVQSILALLQEDPRRAYILASSPRGRSGLKLYLPPPTEEGLNEFKRIIDLAAFCRCDFVMLELGGALEYKRHREINEAWIRYCRTMNEYPGKTLDVQESCSWHKNSIHSENGGGRFLTQEQFVHLVDYCRERFLEVIAEMPSLSHSDYILAAHPEMAERPEDPFPDACCPLHEGYQRLYKDLLDEVADLIHPERINIGHDELYTFCCCPRCRDQDPQKLYAEDIDRITSYLASRNIKTVIWGEKFLNSHWKNGAPIGGAEAPPTETKEAVRALYGALDLLKEKPEIMHWYWSVDRELDQVYAQKGLTYYFGNLNPVMFKEWEKRISEKSCAGTCVSNWGQTSFRTLQRNGVLYDLYYTSLLMWNTHLGEQDFQELDKAVFEGLYRWRGSTTGGTGAKEGAGTGKSLQVTHTVRCDIKFQYFFDGFLLNEATFLLGHHLFTDDDGNEYRFPVIFGSNISNDNIYPERGEDPEGMRDAWVYNLQHPEVAGECLKEYDHGTVWYTCCYDLPFSVQNLEYKGFEQRAGEKSAKVRLAGFTLL